MIRQRITSVFASLAVALAGVTLSVAPIESEAKRLGSGRASGMQRQMPAKQADSSPPAQNATPNQAAKPAQAAPANAAAQTAAQPAKRSWMGPIAGLAAGLGLAALASHFGFGEELANFMMIAVLAVVAMVAIGWVMRRMRGGAQASGPQLAGAGAPFPASGGHQQAMGSTMAREAQGVFNGGSSAGAAAAGLASASVAARPEGFDADGFTRIAKMIFIRLQAANDEANLDDLRKFTTPELFASLRLDLQERGQSSQQTDVMQLDAELVDTAQENGQWVASVRFSGLIREEVGQGAEPFNELWHLVKPLDGAREWAIAGITPLQA